MLNITKYTNKNQKGFAVLESLLIVVVIAIIAGTGYYVWNTKSQTDTSLNSASSINQTTASAPIVKSFADCQKAAGSITQQSYPEVCVTKDNKSFTQPTSQNYLNIKEWGVELPLSPSISDATYAAVDDGYGGYKSDTYGLSTKSLTALDPECGANKNSPGRLVRQTSATHDTNVAKSSSDPLNYQVYSTKIGDYYYGFVQTHAACSNIQSISSQQAALISPFKTAFGEIKASN